MSADSPTNSVHRTRIPHPDSGWGEVTTKPVTWSFGKLRRLYDYSMFVLLVGAVIVLTIVLETDDKVVALKVCAVAYFSLLPAILYLQFTSRKTLTVWREYVLTLFRLHADDYGHLPEPPLSSRYHEPWRKARLKRVNEVKGRIHHKREEENVYRRRFEELYGPVPTERDTTESAVGLERAHKLQVLIATLLITLGWVFVLQPETVFGNSFTPGDFELRGLPAIPEESIAFAFLGAYFFVLQMLVRRYFQNDLKATAYVHATMRIIIVVLLVWVLDPVLPESLGQPERSAIAFAIGVFPTVGWQALQAVVAALLHRAVPALESSDPLSNLDGMNVWYEARLVEEGIEDVQNLATADIGNALLRTRIPPERLIDWVDQALLRLHVPTPAREREHTWFWRKRQNAREEARKDEEARKKDESKETDLERLRRFGIRTATDLLDALAYEGPVSNGETFRSGVERILNKTEDAGHSPSVTRAIAVCFRSERNLQHVLAWRSFKPTPDLKEERLLKLALADSDQTTNGGPTTVEPPVTS